MPKALLIFSKFKLLLEITLIYSLICSTFSGSFMLLTYNHNLVSASAS